MPDAIMALAQQQALGVVVVPFAQAIEDRPEDLFDKPIPAGRELDARQHLFQLASRKRIGSLRQGGGFSYRQIGIVAPLPAFKAQKIGMRFLKPPVLRLVMHELPEIKRLGV